MGLEMDKARPTGVHRPKVAEPGFFSTKAERLMSNKMAPTEFVAIYNALDESRKQELVDHALELLEEQRDERRTEQRV